MERQREGDIERRRAEKETERQRDIKTERHGGALQPLILLKYEFFDSS